MIFAGVKGFFIGIAMAAPVGPLALLCIRASLQNLYRGSATALGVAVADGFYAFIAALGVSIINQFILERREYFFMAGGLLLIFLGIRALMHSPSFENTHLRKGTFVTTFAQTMLLTLTNPMTMVTFIAAFAALGFEEAHDLAHSIAISSGVFVGSFSWFMSLSILVSSIKKRFTPELLHLLNILAGSFLTIFGLFFMAHSASTLIQKVYYPLEKEATTYNVVR